MLLYKGEAMFLFHDTVILGFDSASIVDYNMKLVSCQKKDKRVIITWLKYLLHFHPSRQNTHHKTSRLSVAPVN